MSRFRAAFAALCLFVCAIAYGQIPAGYTQVSGAHTGGDGSLVSNATIVFSPVAANGTPISFRAGGAGGAVMTQPFTAQVTNGAFSVALPDSGLTSPANVCYSVQVIDNTTGASLLGPGYGCVQPTGGTWSLDSYTPNLPALAVQTAGPAGQSAYQIAVGNGFSGTVAQWIASLQGAPGQNGTTTLGQLARAAGAQGASIYEALGVGQRMLWDGTLRLGYIDPNGVTQTQYGNNFSILGPIPVADVPLVNGSRQITCNFPIGFQGRGDIGGFWRDPSGNSAGSFVTYTAAGTPLTLPDSAVTFEPTFQGANVPSTLACYTGSTVPATPIPYTVGIPSVPTLSQIRSIAGAAAAVARTASTNKISTLPVNFYNPANLTAGYFLNADGSLTANSAFSVSDYFDVTGAPGLISNMTLGYGAGAAVNGIVLFTGTKAVPTQIGYIPGSFAPGTFIPIPASLSQATLARVTIQTPLSPSSSSTPYIGSGTTLPTILPPYSYQSILLPLAGKRVLAISDSIFGTDGGPDIVMQAFRAQNVADFARAGYPATYGNPPGQNGNFSQKGAYSASTAYSLNDLVYEGGVYYNAIQPGAGNDPATSPAFWTNAAQAAELMSYPGVAAGGLLGIFDGNFAANPGGPDTPHQLATALSDKAMIVVETLGNNPNTPVGSLTDAPSNSGGASLYAQLNYLFGTIGQAQQILGRYIPVIFMGMSFQVRPGYFQANTFDQVQAAGRTFAQENSLPFLDPAATGPVNKWNYGTYLVQDTDGSGNPFWVHHTAIGGTAAGNWLGRQIRQYLPF